MGLLRAAIPQTPLSSPSQGPFPTPRQGLQPPRSGATSASCSPKCLESTTASAKPSDEDLAGPVPCRAGMAVLACLAVGLGGRRMLLGKGCGGPSGSPGSLLCKWTRGPGLCWPPQQPIAPGNASFCLCLEGTQQKRAAKSGLTF